jgi:hypothetical protein
MAIMVERLCLAEMFNQAMAKQGLGGGQEKTLEKDNHHELYVSKLELHIGDRDMQITGRWQALQFMYARVGSWTTRNKIMSISGDIKIPWQMEVGDGRLQARFGDPKISHDMTGLRRLLSGLTVGFTETLLYELQQVMQSGLKSKAEREVAALPTASELIDQNADKLHEWATTQRAGVTREVVVDLAKRFVAPALTMQQTGGNLILSLPLAKMNLRGLKVEL